MTKKHFIYLADCIRADRDHFDETALTPTPWTLTPRGVIESMPGIGIEHHSSTHGDSEIAFVFGTESANAAYLVHCVNTHAALVAALEASLLAIPDGMTSNTSPICQQIRAALALAHGKE